MQPRTNWHFRANEYARTHVVDQREAAIEAARDIARVRKDESKRVTDGVRVIRQGQMRACRSA